MENILVTTFLYAVIFYVLCNFVKTKAPKPTLATTTTQALDVVTVQDETIASSATTDKNNVDIAPVALVEPSKTVTEHILNEQSLACIFVDREVKTTIKPSNKKRKKKQNISSFIREVGTSEVIHNKNFATIT